MTTSITTNHPCLITSVELDCSWEGFSASEKIPRSGVGGWGWGALDWEQSGRDPLDGLVWEYGSALLFFLKPLPDNIMGEEKPQFDQSWGVGDPFGDHHCGNIVNYIFLRPWEPHTKVYTHGHGKLEGQLEKLYIHLTKLNSGDDGIILLIKRVLLLGRSYFFNTGLHLFFHCCSVGGPNCGPLCRRTSTLEADINHVDP